jgi:Arc/MetJ-type ribon-helix-helix transcriptional regulator
MHIEIEAETERLVREEISSGHFRSIDELIRAGVEAWREKNIQCDTKASHKAASRRHIGAVIVERMRNVPPEIMAAMPEDGASQHDHYIYGLPKRSQ